MRGKDGHKEFLAKCVETITGAYTLAPKGQEKFTAAIKQESLFRNLATDIQVYGHNCRIKTVSTDDVAIWVPEGGSIPLSDGMGEFSDIILTSHKVAVFLKLEDTLVRDPFFKIEDYLVKRLAKNFGRAEDNCYINGNGVNMPTGILAETGGADIGVTSETLTYDE